MGSSSPAGDGTRPPALGARNLSCWTTREAQTLHFWQAPRWCCTCCRSVARTWIRESLCRFPKAGEVCLCVHVVGRGLATSHSVPLPALGRCLAFRTLCGPHLINLLCPGRACVRDTGAFISQMERPRCWGSVTGPRSRGAPLA